MKVSIKALPFVLIAGMTHQVAQAETKQAEGSPIPKQAIAVMSSGIIGGLLGGPIGFFVAAVGADLLVDNESSIARETLPDENIKRLVTIEPLIASSIDLAQALPVQPLNKTTTLNTENAKGESAVEASEVTLAAINMDTSTMTSTLLKDESELAINSDKVGITLLFGSSQHAVIDSMNEQLLAFSKALKKFPTGLIQIDGHTDPRGDSEFNLDLAQRRADAVADFLILQGFDPALIVVRSYGETRSSSGDYDYDAHIAERSVDVSISAVLMSSIVSQDGFSSEVSMPVAQNRP